MLILFLDQQPFIPLRGFLHAHDSEAAVELAAVQFELEIAALKLTMRTRLADNIECAFVPKHDTAAAIAALGNVPLEGSVVKGMILHFHRQRFAIRIETRTFWNGPTHQHAAHFEPEIIMQMRRVMTLHAKEPGTIIAFALSGFSAEALASFRNFFFLRTL